MSSTIARSARTRSRKAGPAPQPAVANRKPEFWKIAAITAAIVLAAVVVYSPGLNGAFVFDDRTLPFRLRGFGEDVSTWIRGVRPVLMLSYWFDFIISGARHTFSYHVFNLVIHMMNTALVFVIARKLLAPVEQGRTRDLLAGFAAGLFLLHPLQTEAVTYITGRSDVLSAFFLLASFAAFLHWRRDSISFHASIAIVALFAIACLTKENAAAFPVAFLAADLYLMRGALKTILRNNWRLYSLLAACGASGLVIVWRVLAAASTAGFALRDLRWYEYLFTQWKVVWIYIGLFLFPARQTIDHDVAISRTPWDDGALIYLLALCALVAAAWFYRRKLPLAFFGLVLALLLLAPTSSFVPINDLAVERRMYLPMLGMVLAAADLLRVLAPERKSLVYAMAAILGVSGTVTFHRNGVWRSETTLWADAAAKSPGKARTRMRYGYALLNAHRCLESSREFAAASRLAPPTYELYTDWALASECMNNTPDAIAKLRAAAAIEPRAHAYTQIARIEIKQGLFDDAFRALNQAEKIDPSFTLTYVYRGTAHSMLRQYQNAIQDFQRALALDPSDAAAQRGLANAQSQLNAERNAAALPPAARVRGR